MAPELSASRSPDQPPRPPGRRCADLVRFGGRRVGDYLTRGGEAALVDSIILREAAGDRRLAERLVQLETVNQEMLGFAERVAYDLRGPVRHLDDLLGLLAFRLGGKGNARIRELLNKARAVNQEAASRLEAALRFTRLASEPMALQWVDLNVLVAEVVADFQLELQDRPVVWEIGVLPAIQGDPGMLRSVFRSLIGNALKFSLGALETRVQVGFAGDPALGPVVFVRDRGIGFDPAQAADLFRPFRLPRLRDRFQGTGIGLACVKRILCRHGGQVWAEGSPNQGATFFLAFPGQDRPQAPAARPGPGGAAAG